MSSEFEYDLRDALAYIRARVLESQQEYDALVAGGTHTHENIDSGSLYSQSSTSVFCLSRNVSICSSCSVQSQHNSPSTYREIVAKLYAEIFRDGSQQHLRDAETLCSESNQDSRCNELRSGNIPAVSTATPLQPRRRFSFQPDDRPEEETCTHAQHIEPHSSSCTVIRSVPFDENAIGPWTTASEQQPAGKASKPDDSLDSQKEFSFESASKLEEICAHTRYPEPLARSTMVARAVRFEEHIVGPPPKMMESTQVENKPPLGKVAGSVKSLERARSVSGLRQTLSLRRRKSIGQSSASSVPSVPASRPSRTDSVLQRDRTNTASETNPPTYHPLTTVPVKRGWVKRMARAFTEKGEENRH